MEKSQPQPLDKACKAWKRLKILKTIQKTQKHDPQINHPRKWRNKYNLARDLLVVGHPKATKTEEIVKLWGGGFRGYIRCCAPPKRCRSGAAEVGGSGRAESTSGGKAWDRVEKREGWSTAATTGGSRM